VLEGLTTLVELRRWSYWPACPWPPSNPRHHTTAALKCLDSVRALCLDKSPPHLPPPHSLVTRCNVGWQVQSLADWSELQSRTEHWRTDGSVDQRGTYHSTVMCSSSALLTFLHSHSLTTRSTSSMLMQMCNMSSLRTVSHASTPHTRWLAISSKYSRSIVPPKKQLQTSQRTRNHRYKNVLIKLLVTWHCLHKENMARIVEEIARLYPEPNTLAWCTNHIHHSVTAL